MLAIPLAAVGPLREVLRLAARRAATARRPATAADVFAALADVDDPVAAGVVAAFPQLAPGQTGAVSAERPRRLRLLRRHRASEAVKASASAALSSAAAGGNPLSEMLRRLGATDEGRGALAALTIEPVAWDRTVDALS